MTAETLPLPLGSILQVKVSLDEPGYPLVVLFSASGRRKCVYPKNEAEQEALNAVVDMLIEETAADL